MAIVTLDGPKLAERTTMRLGGRAVAELLVELPEDAHGLEAALAHFAAPPLVIGRGSNLLAKDGDLDLVLVSLPRRSDGVAVKDAGGNVQVRVHAGTDLSRLLGWCMRHGLGGLEGLAGVPGTVGGAVAANAGSFGSVTGDAVTGIVAFTPDLGLKRLGPGEMSFGYRTFSLASGADFFLIFEAEFALTRRSPQAVRQAFIEAMRKKKASQPLNYPSAGCVFKNPPGTSAGLLLDRAGFRGKRLGGMAFSEKHANFLVNLGGGTAAQALELIESARGAVRRDFGIDLELEVRVVG